MRDFLLEHAVFSFRNLRYSAAIFIFSEKIAIYKSHPMRYGAHIENFAPHSAHCPARCDSLSNFYWDRRRRFEM